MKNSIFLLIFFLILIACDNQILDPNIGDPPEIDKRGSPQELIAKEEILPTKTYKMVPMLNEYIFNPDLKGGGGFLRKSNTQYAYENERERTIKNLKIYSPSKLVVDGMVYKTYNIYTINRHELLSEKGTVTEGRSWGTFKIYKVRDEVIDDDERALKYDQVTDKPLEDLGSLLFGGEFAGSIAGNNMEINLLGKGSDEFSGKSLVASENSICDNSGMLCWSSKISGKIRKVDYIDD